MKNVVTIGGGTGSFTLLSGLKKYNVGISAIVTMADDGGSTGILRDELGVLPPGDVRQCLVALSESSTNLRRLMSYRFNQGGLKGHSFGNLLLSALEKTEGDFSRGLKEASKILNIKGTVIPVSDAKMHLCIELNNGGILKGESHLDHSTEIRKNGVKRVFLRPNVKASSGSLKAIRRADLIVIGPGDHYGSIVPNLLCQGISNEIRKSRAKVCYVCNLSNKKGQTDRYSLDDYAESINQYLKEDRIDFVLIPTERASEELVKKYERREGKGSVIDFGELEDEKRGYKIVKASILKNSKNFIPQGTFIRHDSDKLAKAVVEILELNGNRVIKEII